MKSIEEYERMARDEWRCPCGGDVYERIAGSVLWRHCERCEDYISLGEASDTFNVHIEIRAAEIAADYVDLPWVEWNHGEAAGFDNRETPMPHSAESWHAGYLARAIVEHDKDAP